jgi:hypothetical protein
MAVYTSESTRLQLEQPRELFTSPTKMIVELILYTAVAALLFYMGYTKHSVTWYVITGALLLFAFVNVLQHWKYRARPMLILSKEGLRLCTKHDTLVRWTDLVENVWHQQRYSFMTTSAYIVLHDRTQAKPYRINSKWLRIKADEYLRLCDLYAAAARTDHA